MRGDKIKQFILKKVDKHPQDLVNFTAKHFNVTRTTVHRHINSLITDNRLIKSGTTRNIHYYLSNAVEKKHVYKITSKIDEFGIFEKDFKDIFNKYPKNIYDICDYGFTEIFNNAIDHSRGKTIVVETLLEDNLLVIKIQDDGIGIFQKIYDYFKLSELRESILQLNKGKMTTDPSNHTGEGIFFSSRAFDIFELYANKIHYTRDNRIEDWTIQSVSTMKSGTLVKMSIDTHSNTDLVRLFEKYQNPESLEFNHTDILVELSRMGHETLISRSQAKRIVFKLEKFHHVTLDFKNIRLVGQGFVDEVFRVFQNQHPTMIIDYVNANEDVTFMIERGLATARGKPR